MRTLSPIFIPNLITSPLLCNVVFSTVTPDTTTGATLETGVILPVLPTCHSTSIKTVVASSGGNFHANAHLGWCAVIPKSSLLSNLSNFITIPSISQSASALFCVQYSIAEVTASIVESLSKPDAIWLPATSIPTLCNQEIISESYVKLGGI